MKQIHRRGKSERKLKRPSGKNDRALVGNLICEQRRVTKLLPVSRGDAYLTTGQIRGQFAYKYADFSGRPWARSSALRKTIVWNNIVKYPSPTWSRTPFPPSLSLAISLARGRPDGLANRRRLKQQQNWHALKFASQEMKGDRELCMAAVAQDWWARQREDEWRPRAVHCSGRPGRECSLIHLS